MTKDEKRELELKSERDLEKKEWKTDDSQEVAPAAAAAAHFPLRPDLLTDNAVTALSLCFSAFKNTSSHQSNSHE